MQIRRENFDIGIMLNIAGFGDARPLFSQVNGLRFICVELQPDFLDVKDDIRHILGHPRNRRKLV